MSKGGLGPLALVHFSGSVNGFMQKSIKLFILWLPRYIIFANKIRKHKYVYLDWPANT